MKRWVWLLLITAITAVAQSNSGTIAASGGTISVLNPSGYTLVSFEELPSGTPATVSVTVQGCMRGGTCDTAADTNTTASAVIRSVSFTKAYDYFLVTASWTGGTSPSYTINSRQSGSAAGGSGSNVTVVGPVDGSGYVNVDCKTGCTGGNPNGQAAMAASAPVVIASNQSAVAGNMTQVAGQTLGAVANYGTSPGAVLVQGVNAFVTNTPPVSQSGTWNMRNQDGSGNALTTNSTTFTAKFALDGNILGSLGTPFTTPGFVDVKGADGNVFVRQATASNLNATVVESGTWVDNITQFGGTNVSTGTGAGGAGIPRVTISNDSSLAANQSTNVNQVAGTALGATAVTNFGTAPAAAAVPGVNASIYAGTGSLSANSTTTGGGKFALDTNITSILGVTTNVAAGGTLKVGIVGNAAASVDALMTAGTAPNNGLAVLGQYNSTSPAPTTTQTQALQTDAWGNLLVKEFRRGKTVGQATTIASSSSATTILAAQGAAIFGDISTLVITVVPAATVDLAFTATLSDGTANYVFDMDTGALATAPADPTTINVSFPVPLPATTANTVWTLQLSVTTVTVHVTVVAVQQKAG